MKHTFSLPLLTVLALVSPVAFAQIVPPTFDVTSITDYIVNQIIPAIIAVGAVIILMSVVSVGFKWIKGMLFG